MSKSAIIEEADLLRGAAIDSDEKAMLGREFEEYQANPNVGADWKEVEPRFRQYMSGGELARHCSPQGQSRLAGV